MGEQQRQLWIYIYHYCVHYIKTTTLIIILMILEMKNMTTEHMVRIVYKYMFCLLIDS